MLKALIRSTLLRLGILPTRNLAYDYYTFRIIRSCFADGRHTGAFVDVGAHEGEIIQYVRGLSPAIEILGFEPLPVYFEKLKHTFARDPKVHLYNVALSDVQGQTTFTWVKNKPAYSGFRQRDYDGATVELEEIQVEVSLFDELYALKCPVQLIKIDVEGAEWLVLQGMQRALREDRPLILFEFGLGASNYYASTPGKMFAFFDELGYGLWTLKDFDQKRGPLSAGAFTDMYESRKEYYFVAKAK